MTFYHGSPVQDLKELIPKLSHHDKSCIYFATNEVVATFYMVHALDIPYAWYPYGFDKHSNIPIYTEYYPNALEDIYSHKTGYLYECEHIPHTGNPTNINCAYICEQPIKIDRCSMVLDVYEKLLEYEKAGKLIIRRYDTLSEKQKDNIYNIIKDEIINYNLISKINDSYGNFLKSRFPTLWKSVETEFLSQKH